VNSPTENEPSNQEKPWQNLQQPHPSTEAQEHDKNKQQTKTTKHTIEFSNNKTR
jgi:outer membrane protein OmpA-like peptidoglycan-associated protein